jgi:hypothetical protein
MSYYDFIFDENDNRNMNEGFAPNFVDNSVTPDMNTPLEESYGNQVYCYCYYLLLLLLNIIELLLNLSIFCVVL